MEKSHDFHETFETNHGLEDGIIPTAFTEMHYVNISLNGRHTHTTVVSSDCNRAENAPSDTTANIIIPKCNVLHVFVVILV